MSIPNRVFIVPYRNRIQHKFFFSNQMNFILENESDYEIYFSHQHDERNFNRGATKNIGFLAIKNKYPNDYKNISFIFNDVDTLPFHKIFNYQTDTGIVKHYYGFKYALGGIVVIKGEDFEKINGYPNYWGWGNEDSGFQKRCEQNGLVIDRSHFYPIGSPEILQLFDGVARLISHRDYQRNQHDDHKNGLSTIHKLSYSIDKTSKNDNDNKYVVEFGNDRLAIINISSFLTSIHFESEEFHEYDLREPTSNIVYPKHSKTGKKDISANEWTNIPSHISRTPASLSASLYAPRQQQQQSHQQSQQQQRQSQQQQMQQFQNRPRININPFSPHYAKIVGAKPTKTSAGVNIGLGGVR